MSKETRRSHAKPLIVEELDAALERLERACRIMGEDFPKRFVLRLSRAIRHLEALRDRFQEQAVPLGKQVQAIRSDLDGLRRSLREFPVTRQERLVQRHQRKLDITKRAQKPTVLVGGKK